MENEPKPPLPMIDGVSLLSAPANHYADQLVQLQVAPFVTRITVGMALGQAGSIPTPVATVTMPTDAALFMALEIIRSIKMQPARTNFAAYLKRFEDALAAQT